MTDIPPPPGLTPAMPSVVLGRQSDKHHIVIVGGGAAEHLNALAGHSRVLTTEGFTMSSDSTRPPYTMKSKIALKVYFKQVPAEAAAPAPAK